MTKFLLYLSLLLASGITAGGGAVSVDDNQLAQQYSFCEQSDSNKVDCDDQEDPASLGSSKIVEHSQPLAIGELVLCSLNSFSSHYFIRAPPTSH